jgi:hypothetical protein
MFDEHRRSVLASTFDSLRRFYESCTGRSLNISHPYAKSVSADDYRLP